MTPQQTLAIENPCLTSAQRICSQYRVRHRRKNHHDLEVERTLTVDVGAYAQEYFQGRALWRVSVALIPKPGFIMLPCSKWSARHRRIAHRWAQTGLMGVGILSSDQAECHALQLTVRRLCRPGERRRVPELVLENWKPDGAEANHG